MLILFVCILVWTPQAKAASEPNMIVVPDDYESIQDAIIDANVGDTVFVKNGVYRVDENTSITVYKTLSLVGEDPKNTIIQGNYSHRPGGTAIRVAATDVTVSGFTITNCRVAITNVNYGAEAYPSGCKIINNNIVNNSEGIRPRANNVLISGNNITNCGTGISGYNTKSITIVGNSITENSYGINIGQSNYITVAKNNISNNKGGLNMIYYGPYSVHGNNFTKNDWGLCFAEGCRNATVYGNNISENGIAVWLLTFPVGGEMAISGEGNTFFGNLLIENTQQISQHEIQYANINIAGNKGTDKVTWNNSTVGNYWDDYNGTDQNGNNIGETPYIIDEKNQDNYPLTKKIDTKTIIPEFPTNVILQLFLATIVAVTIYKKELVKNQSEKISENI